MRPRTMEDFRTHERMVWDHMRARRGQFVSLDDLIPVLYPDPDDEPQSAKHGVFAVIHALRKRHGLPIITARGWITPAIQIPRAPGASPAGEAS